MEINILVLSLGNSRVAIAVFEAGTLQNVVRIPYEHSEQFAPAIAEAWKSLAGRDAAVVGASVNPPRQEMVENIVLETVDRTVRWVGEELELPIAVRTAEPRLTGVDRVLNMAAAFEQLETACIVVDAGTAITVDCCNERGEFLGGAIAPGAGMMLDALHQRTALLPRVTLSRPDGAFGDSTESAIRHGVYFGIRGMVRELIENIATELGRWPEVIATGGDAAMLFEGWDVIHAISPDLLLYGIALAYTKHHIEHET